MGSQWNMTGLKHMGPRGTCTVAATDESHPDTASDTASWRSGCSRPSMAANVACVSSDRSG